MKAQLEWLGFVALFTAVTAATLVCATVETSRNVLRSPLSSSKMVRREILTEEILAMGRPDAALSKKLGREHVVAFLGSHHTYLLYRGGEELESISELNLDGKRMDISASSELYMEDKRVWGELILNYAYGTLATERERQELERGGFTVLGAFHQKKIVVEGVVLPVIQLPAGHGTKLSIPRTIHLWDPQLRSKNSAAQIVAADLGWLTYAIMIDVAFAPISVPLGVMMILSEKH
jgi:hypothetical protein